MVLATNGRCNLVESNTHWIIVDKEDGHEINKCSKDRNPIFPVAAVAKWGYTPVDTKRMNEIMKSA